MPNYLQEDLDEIDEDLIRAFQNSLQVTNDNVAKVKVQEEKNYFNEQEQKSTEYRFYDLLIRDDRDIPTYCFFDTKILLKDGSVVKGKKQL